MKLSHTCSIYLWLWQACHYLFQQLTLWPSLSGYSRILAKMKGKNTTGTQFFFFFNSLFLGQTITDCVSKWRGGGEFNKTMRCVTISMARPSAISLGLLWQYIYSQYYTTSANIWKYRLWNFNRLCLTVWPHTLL